MTSTLAVASLLLTLAAANLPASPDSSFRQWGKETLDRIQSELWIESRGVYAEEAKPGAKPDKPAFTWSWGVQLSALAGATRLEPATYAPLLRRAIAAVD